jgi:DNA-binding LacI/PurR family transcriptional regulator
MTIGSNGSTGAQDRRPVTMKDVAEAAGVAQSTVSRILNDVAERIPISVETRERVQAIATQLDYRPHPFARALRGAPTMLLGAVVRDITDAFFASALAALSNAARERGYALVLGDARAKAAEALALTAVLEERQCDAIVLVGDLRNEPRLVEDLRGARIRVVALWHGTERRGRPFPTVGVDNRAGVRAAMDHLTSIGHRNIAFVGTDALGDMQERLSAYREYCALSDLASTKSYVRLVANKISSGERALATLWALSPRPTAIVAANDTLALGLVHAAFEGNIAVPDDLSIVGFDDVPLAAAAVPGLTTLRMPTAEIVAAGVELAIGTADWPRDFQDLAPTVFQPKLIVRRSTAAIKPKA